MFSEHPFSHTAIERGKTDAVRGPEAGRSKFRIQKPVRESESRIQECGARSRRVWGDCKGFNSGRAEPRGRIATEYLLTQESAKINVANSSQDEVARTIL